MSFLPDYGLALQCSGVSPDFISYFYTLHLDHISAIAPGQFTTMLRVGLDGVDHSRSLDFGADKLHLILEVAPPNTLSQVQTWLLGLHGVETIQLVEPIAFGASACLGQEQRAEKESFVPLVIQEVIPS